MYIGWGEGVQSTSEYEGIAICLSTSPASGLYNILYQPHRAIKSQVLADFITEWMDVELPRQPIDYTNWTMYFDGSKMLAGLGADVVLVSITGDIDEVRATYNVHGLQQSCII